MPAAPGPGRIIHVAMPFALSGSAITNVIRELVAEHARAGGTSTVVLSHNRETSIDGSSELYVDHTTQCPREYFTAWEMRRDHLAGLLGLVRPFTARLALPAIEAVSVNHGDVIIVHEGHYATSTLPMWRRAHPDARLVLYVHTPVSRAYGRRELRRLLSCADDVVFVSDSLRRRTMSRVDVAIRTHTILNGTRVVPAAESSAPTRGALFVGQLVPWKGAHLLIDAVAELFREGILVPTTIVGAPVHGAADSPSEYEERLRDAAAPLGDLVTFRGFIPREKLDTEYQGAQLVCFPSIWEEPCGLVLLEALGNGAAVVTTRRGGIPEVGKDAVAYFDERIAGSLADQIRALIGNPDALRALRTRARERASEITWPAQYSKLIHALSSTEDAA